ncbi:MAG: DHH family phosphoesterase [Treponema sp.]|jgi:phosphoesterase RecJ-like protein|nr:DHH family phosphoesterase [Treponema sp.]
MAVPVPEALIRFIQGGAAFIVAGHEEPDGDCVCSQLVLASVLRRLGKRAVPCSAGPFKRSEIKPFIPRFMPCPEGDERAGMRVLVVDCSIRERTGNLPLEGLPAAVIDHHASGDPWGEAVFLDPRAPSVTAMILRLMEALGMEPSAEEAELLLLGLCTDTGFFRHVEGGAPESFEAAAKLTAAGANPKKVFAAINGGKTLNSRLLLGTVLAKTRAYYGGALLLSSESREDSLRFGQESRGSDMIYQLLQSVEGVEAMVLIRQENEEECSLGFRSLDRIDVASIAETFGGGGHRNAAGAKTRGTIGPLEERVAAAFAPWFSGKER